MMHAVLHHSVNRKGFKQLLTMDTNIAGDSIITCGLLNVQSLGSKTLEIRNLMEDSNRYFMITET